MWGIGWKWQNKWGFVSLVPSRPRGGRMSHHPSSLPGEFAYRPWFKPPPFTQIAWGANQGKAESRKNLEQEVNFQIATLGLHVRNQWTLFIQLIYYWMHNWCKCDGGFLNYFVFFYVAMFSLIRLCPAISHINHIQPIILWLALTKG